ncbi:MAG: hypothetical protein JNM26_18315 [Ideonella sp.]|nr:hypothetical protein [Ideonella sp.]
MKWRGKEMGRAGVAWTAAQVVAAAVGAKYGYDFGHEVSGWVLGVALAANAAVFGALAVSAVADGVDRWRPARRDAAHRKP